MKVLRPSVLRCLQSLASLCPAVAVCGLALSIWPYAAIRRQPCRRRDGWLHGLVRPYLALCAAQAYQPTAAAYLPRPHTLTRPSIEHSQPLSTSPVMLATDSIARDSTRAATSDTWQVLATSDLSFVVICSPSVHYYETRSRSTAALTAKLAYHELHTVPPADTRAVAASVSANTKLRRQVTYSAIENEDE